MNGTGKLNDPNYPEQWLKDGDVVEMDIDNSGVGSAEVNATKELKVSDSFLGKVRNKGAAQVKRPRVI